MLRQRYPGDLPAADWEHSAPLIPAATLGGRPRDVDSRAVRNDSFAVAREGNSWRAMPHDLP